MALARDLRKVFRRPLVVEGHEVATTASVGIAFTLDASETADDLLRHADSAMYAAKELGRDRIEVFDETLRAKVRRRLQNEIELRQAIEHGELIVHYQPEVEVPSGRVLAVEALVRWHHPTRGLLAAAEFIGLAEETGLILDIGLWVLREACASTCSGAPGSPTISSSCGSTSPRSQLGEPDLLPNVVEHHPRDRHRARLPVPRDHRDRGDGRRRGVARGAGEAARARRRAGHRRLRDRLLVAQLPQAPARSTC